MKTRALQVYGGVSFDNPRRLERLRKLSALKAIETWMDAGFTIGEDDALLFAIRAGTRTKLSDAKITDLIWDCIDSEVDAQTCLSKIRAM
jgi:hypothetical protein